MNSKSQKHLVSHQNSEENLALHLEFGMALARGARSCCPSAIMFSVYCIMSNVYNVIVYNVQCVSLHRTSSWCVANDAVAYIPRWGDRGHREKLKQFLLYNSPRTLLRCPFLLALGLVRTTLSSWFSVKGSGPLRMTVKSFAALLKIRLSQECSYFCFYICNAKFWTKQWYGIY